MDYIGPVDGSPIIPNGLVFLYLVINLLLFVIVFIFLRKKRRRSGKNNPLKIFLYSLAGFHLILLVAMFFGIFYYLVPAPKVISVNPHPATAISDMNKKIEIVFDKPVKRKEITKNIFPDTPGLWVFEKPFYNTHLYRKLVFYPKFPLQPGISYTVSISNIKNFFSFKLGSSYQFGFRTQIPSGILGVQTEKKGTGIYVTGSFPEKGWIQVAVDVPVKITFNSEVDKKTAEDRFFISPSIKGQISWEGNTLVFTPYSYFPFNTIYTVKIFPDVSGLDGSKMENEYVTYFATQEKIFKLDVPANYQKYALSCEIAALRMALLYRGVDVDEDTLLGLVGYDPTVKSGNNWGNPYVGFVGNVKGKQMATGFGVFWEPVARAANKYRYAKSIENWTLDKLTETIQKGNPVIVWVSSKSGKAVEWSTRSGDDIKTVADEHAVVAVGFMGATRNPSHIIINDPLVGQTYWEKDLFLKKWSLFKNSGVIVY